MSISPLDNEFITYTKAVTTNGGKIFLTFDGYFAYLSFSMLKKCDNSIIILYDLQSHSSGKIQLIDLVELSDVRNKLKSAAQDYALLKDDRNLGLF